MQRALGRTGAVISQLAKHQRAEPAAHLEDEKKLDDQRFDALHAMADGQTPEAIHDLAVGLIGRGMSNNNRADIEQGEAHPKQAVRPGHPAAIKYQDEVWALIRPRLEQKLKGHS
jgi:hypothetical protein